MLVVRTIERNGPQLIACEGRPWRSSSTICLPAIQLSRLAVPLWLNTHTLL
jgi:hypothetical protein